MGMFDELLGQLDKNASMMGKTNMLQVCTNLTAVCHNTKSKPEDVVATFWKIMELLLKKGTFRW